MNAGEASDIVEHMSAVPFDATLELLTAAIARAGLILFGRIDHRAGARDARLEMPPATVLTYGHAKGGTPVMGATPLRPLICRCASLFACMTTAKR